jgi:L-ascorbate metabolism protein UlaG (beta-lactamase superfamily)
MAASRWRSRARRGTLVVFVLGLGVLVHSTDELDALGATASGERLERMRRSPNFRDGVFHNPVETHMMGVGKGVDLVKEWWEKRGSSRPPKPLPRVALARESFGSAAPEGVRACWMGHSTVLVELEGQRLLFDPVWSERASPSTLVGPLRFGPAPLPLEQVPALSAVVISHDHYDHLDKATVVQLAKAQPSLRFYVPLGVGAHLEKWGIAPDRISELDWGEEAALPSGLRLAAVPSRHFSGRGVLDRDKTLWAAWAVVGRTHRVFFGGDGGYFDGYAKVGERLGPFDLAMLEIGAFNANWGQIHLGPEKALVATRDLKAQVLLPIHWAGFNLAVHRWDEPIATLVEGAAAAGVRLLVPKMGQLVQPSDAAEPAPWWRDAS